MHIFDELIGKEIILNCAAHYNMKCRLEGYSEWFIKVFEENKKGGRTLFIPIKSINEIVIA